MSGVFLRVCKDRLTGGLQLSIDNERTGYRIHGPKLCGQSKDLIRHALTAADVDQLERYCADAKAALSA
jgi:hypothetical protein